MEHAPPHAYTPEIAVNAADLLWRLTRVADLDPLGGHDRRSPQFRGRAAVLLDRALAAQRGSGLAERREEIATVPAWSWAAALGGRAGAFGL